MKCQCGNEHATKIRIRYNEKGEKQEVCDKCAGIRFTDVTDVYCPQGGYFDENIADKENRKGTWIRSKAHKWEMLRKLGLEEVGSNRNPMTGKVTPFIKDPEKRRRWCISNFGQEKS